jgi:hypothetical protein
MTRGGLVSIRHECSAALPAWSAVDASGGA